MAVAFSWQGGERLCEGEPSRLGLDQALNIPVGHVHQCRIFPGVERERLALGQPLRER
jgi:hypothetical protein